MASALTLIANPGSASRKYALYDGEICRASLHIEEVSELILCTIERQDEHHQVHLDIHDINDSIHHIVSIFKTQNVLADDEQITHIGLRIVAPSSFFLEDRLMNEEAIGRLEALLPCAPLHIEPTLNELRALQTQFPNAKIIGISDSAFHITKPDYAWNYGLPLGDADHLDIKRFGYHGISVASVIAKLKTRGSLPPRVIVCHLGSGVSITAVKEGKSLDTTMGYSPLDGVIMATRSGNIDPAAIGILKQSLGMNEREVEQYLNTQGGLLGLGGSSDLRELLYREAHGDHIAKLAIETYVFSIQKAIGQMAAALDGVDALLFTGTIGERSAPIRHKIIQNMTHLGLWLDEDVNNTPDRSTASIHQPLSKPVYVIETNESAEMQQRVTLQRRL